MSSQDQKGDKKKSTVPTGRRHSANHHRQNSRDLATGMLPIASINPKSIPTPWRTRTGSSNLPDGWSYSSISKETPWLCGGHAPLAPSPPGAPQPTASTRSYTYSRHTLLSVGDDEVMRRLPGLGLAVTGRLRRGALLMERRELGGGGTRWRTRHSPKLA